MIEQVIQFSFRYKLLILLLFVAVCGAGIYAFTHMPIDAFPDVSPKLVQVFAEVEGMAAEEVEQLISRPVEVAMMGIPGVKKIRSLSSHGLATVNVYFEDDVDIYFAHQQVAERIKLAEEGIPEGVNLPHGVEKGPVLSGMGKILMYYLDADEGYSTTDLRTLQDWVVKRDLQTVPGVAQVLSQGGFVRQYQVRVLPENLLKYDLTIDGVIEAIRRNNQNMGAGLVERGAEELMVRTLGQIADAQDIENIVLKSHRGHPVYVKDVALVGFGEAFRRGVASLNGGQEVAIGGVYKLHGANSFQVIQRVRDRIEEINRTLPPGVKVVVFHDQATLVRNTINTVRSALILGLILVSVTALAFLGNLRSTLVIVLSLPFSILLAFAVMYRYGFAGDLLSFGGVAIALGMIVDATIIMVEKIQSLLRDPSDHRSMREVIAAAGREVGQPIFFATAIIVIVFLPIFALQDVEGKMFRPLAFTVVVTMAGSLLYALVIAPILCGLLHRRDGGNPKPPQATVFHRLYRRVLEFSLNQGTAVMAVVLLMLALGWLTFQRLGREFVPTLQEGAIQVLAHMNPNISLKEIARTTTQIEKDILKTPEVEDVLSEIGYGEVGPHVHHTNYACMTITLRPRDQWKRGRTQEHLVSEISSRLEGYPGVSISFSQPIQHEVDGLVTGTGAQVVAKLFGPDLDVLKEKVAEIESVLSDIPGVADLQTDQFSGQTQVQIALDRDAIARHGLNSHQIQRTIQAAIGGSLVGTVFEQDRSSWINVRFDEPYRNDIEAIEGLLVRTAAGYTVPLRELARINTVTGLRQMTREDTRRFISVQCNVRGRDSGGFVEEAQQAVARAVSLPPGYALVWGGQFELQQAANRRLMIIVPITLFLVLTMLYMLFNSVRSVALIVLNIPLALVGGVFALKLAGANVSIPSSIGFIALFGAALTDGLVLISRFEYLRKQGLALRDAVVEGALSKLRPVMITTLTTAFGLLPLIFSSGVGSEIQRPLAIVVVGGLASSTLLTLIVLPTLYWHTAGSRKDVSAAAASA
ncbi:efflux RND transporter permease subunit [Anaerobaca lacustris]|uniref:CusA/CzcA family heavy metal efflux RND transporter n=1 Tax=Anaerobaca lacustris TaxID=3044600 RepID=A0AAW6U1Q1_9BACT|nr:CusA/CzcA family heavy metal efflux RND transporter [Sedimentisphaerales bacterium M17dextr]